jgi:integrase
MAPRPTSCWPPPDAIERHDRYSDRFVALGKALGLARVPLHGSRHCAASLLADLGVPDVAIAAWLGHTKVEVTQGYTHVFAERLAETGRALGDALTGDPQSRV